MIQIYTRGPFIGLRRLHYLGDKSEYKNLKINFKYKIFITKDRNDQRLRQKIYSMGAWEVLVVHIGDWEASTSAGMSSDLVNSLVDIFSVLKHVKNMDLTSRRGSRFFLFKVLFFSASKYLWLNLNSFLFLLFFNSFQVLRFLQNLHKIPLVALFIYINQ